MRFGLSSTKKKLYDYEDKFSFCFWKNHWIWSESDWCQFDLIPSLLIDIMNTIMPFTSYWFYYLYLLIDLQE